MNENLIKKIQNLVITELKSIYSEIDTGREKLSELNRTIELKRGELEIITKELGQIKEQTDVRIATANEKEVALQELNNFIKREEQRLNNLNALVTAEVAEGKKKIEELTKDIVTLGEERKMRQEQDLIDSDARIKELREELSKRLPELDLKEKVLKTKERDLAVIESRWKKLFKEKGADFKI